MDERKYTEIDLLYFERKDEFGTVAAGKSKPLPREIFDEAIDSMKKKQVKSIPEYLRKCGWWQPNQIGSCLLRKDGEYVSLYEVWRKENHR